MGDYGVRAHAPGLLLTDPFPKAYTFILEKKTISIIKRYLSHYVLWYDCRRANAVACSPTVNKPSMP